MGRQDAEYYERRAARERALAAVVPGWYAARLIASAERFERLAEQRRNPSPKVVRRLLPSERRRLADGLDDRAGDPDSSGGNKIGWRVMRHDSRPIPTYR